jgi:stage II sporulation protein AA (anti-sigma F factor antagonist)
MATDSISQPHSVPSHVLHLTGAFDLATAPGLRDLLEAPTADPSWCGVVDLSAVTFMDCAGLRPLLEAQALVGNRVRFEGLSRQVTRLLVLIGLPSALDHPIAHSSSN